MPVTFATYAVGMMALCGVPLFFSGFWSKDAILHAAHHWPVSQRAVLSWAWRRVSDRVLYDTANQLRCSLARRQIPLRRRTKARA